MMKKSLGRTLVAGAVVATVAVGAVGCASGKRKSTATLKPQEFYTPQHRVTPLPDPAAGQAESSASATATSSAYAAAANGGNARVAPGGVEAGNARTGNGNGNGRTDANATLRGNGSKNGTAGATTSHVEPENTGDVSAGTYMLVGTVIAEVNGTPIYADKILGKLEQALKTKATQDSPPENPKLGPREFALVATDMIRRQVAEDVNEELFFAAAQRSTSEQDQAIAAGLTTVFRAKEVTKAGGSLAVARANSLKEGIEFEDRVQQEYRRNMVRIYLQKRIWPQVQVSADDLREFYNRNKDTLFTEKAEVRFRVLKIGVKEIGSKDAALERAQSLRERAVKGEDFAKLAAQYNQDRTLSRNKGYMLMTDLKDDLGQPVKNEKGEPVQQGAWFAKGTMVNEDLEKAVFELQPGEVTPVLHVGEYFYVAKLEEKKAGRVREFSEPDVQEAIRQRLTAEQRRALQDKEIAKLRKSSVIRAEDKDIVPAIEMAMHKYYAWNRQGQRASAR